MKKSFLEGTLRCVFYCTQLYYFSPSGISSLESTKLQVDLEGMLLKPHCLFTQEIRNLCISSESHVL